MAARSNRTIVGLKLEICASNACSNSGSNRTIVGLKRLTMPFKHPTYLPAAIAPLWD